MMLKPLKKTQKLPIFQKVRGISLTRHADAALLSKAKVISEGKVESAEDGNHVYFGTTFVNIDLDREDLELNTDSEARQLLVDASNRSVFFHSRLMRLARREVELRSAPLLPRCMSTEIAFRVEQSSLLVDINIECPLADPALKANGSQGD